MTQYKNPLPKISNLTEIELPALIKNMQSKNRARTSRNKIEIRIYNTKDFL